MLANVGLSMFNTWRSRCTNEALQEKQRAFQRAAQDRNSERMLQLLREGNAINEQIEKEQHLERLKNVETDFDDLLIKVFESKVIQSWPLKVLPMVMKNESLGTRIIHSSEAIAVHCIFTPSNDNNFNQAVYNSIDINLEQFCNNNLNDLSHHPVIYYSGAWRSNSIPTGADISLLKTKLPNLPVLILYPYFPPSGDMFIKIEMWGMGTEQNLELTPEHLSYKYNRQTEYNDDVINTTVEEFVPFLSYIIGFIADAYFWTLYSTQPIIPTLLQIGGINTDGMRYLIKDSKEQYLSLLADGNDQLIKSSLNGNKVMNLYDGISPFFDDSESNEYLDKLFVNYCHSRCTRNSETIFELCNNAIFTKADKEFLLRYCEKTQDDAHRDIVQKVIKEIDKQLPNITIHTRSDYSLKEVFKWAIAHIPDNAEILQICYIEDVKLLACFYVSGKEVVLNDSENALILIVDNFSVPAGINFDGTLALPVNKIEVIYEQIKIL